MKLLFLQDETDFGVKDDRSSLGSASPVPVQEDTDDPRKKEEKPELPEDVSLWSHS